MSRWTGGDARPAGAPLQSGIGRGLRIRGRLTAAEDLLIDGVFEGVIDLPRHQLTTSARSEVNAIVTARVVTVHGRLEGHISADLVDIAQGARVDANVLARDFALEDGSRFNGAVNTERSRASLEIARHRSPLAALGRWAEQDPSRKPGAADANGTSATGSDADGTAGDQVGPAVQEARR
jgi:cytoskeletal protein CcmA (bactofilin family)